MRTLVASTVLSSMLASAAFASDSRQPRAQDDLKQLVLTASTGEFWVSDLLANDRGVDADTLFSVESEPVYGDLGTIGDRFVYSPRDEFWAVGSDSFVYRLSSQDGDSFATVHLVANRRDAAPEIDLDFEGQDGPLVPLAPGAALETIQALEGERSLRAGPTFEGGGSGVTIELDELDTQGPLTGPHVEPIGVDNGDSDFCLGGLPDPGRPDEAIAPAQIFAAGTVSDVAGYLMLWGPAEAEADLAQVRVGITANLQQLFVEVRGDDDSWYRSATMPRRGATARVRLAWEIRGAQFAALLRSEGSAVRTPVAIYSEVAARPTHLHVGTYPPESGGEPPAVVVDNLEVGNLAVAGLDPAALFDPLQRATGFEQQGLAWDGLWGDGLGVEAAAPVAGHRSLAMHGFADGPSFVSYQIHPPLGVVRELSVEARIDTSLLGIEPGRKVTILTVQSDEHLYFGSMDHELRVAEVDGVVSGSLRFHDGQGAVRGLMWTPLEGEHVVRLQIGRSDGPGMNNGWMRLWVGGNVVQELFNLPNHGKALRTVHLGPKHYLPEAVQGALFFDDLSITR